ncbi:MAG: C40 family peptidase [Muribaculaceae bacterium]|nr:C40 family peptidase [Muribaculaceae bacterium]
MKQYIAFAFAVLSLPVFAQSSANELSRLQQVVDDVKSDYALDKRQAYYDVKAFHNAEGALTVKGTLSDSVTARVLRQELANAGVDYIDSITTFPYKMGQIRIPAASLRTGGRHAAEMSTQAVLGTPIRIMQDDSDFYLVQTPDGYIAWVPSSSVVAKSDDDIKAWKEAARFIVSSPYQVRAYYTADDEGPRNVVTDLVNGCIVVAKNNSLVPVNGKLNIELPDGRTGFIDPAYLTPIEEWAAQDFDAKRILDIAYSMEGTPYLWGGTSTKALDCSGLAKVSYLANGIILMRDASQQALTGTRIEAKDWRQCEAGDLLFFGNAKTGRVTHVAIYDKNGNYVHSSGRVKRNSVDPDSPDYLTTPFLHAVRIHGNEETPGIIRARNHPWYF